MLMSYHLRQERDNRETILPPWHLIMLRMKKGGTKRYPAFGWFTRDWESLVLWLDTILRPTCHKKSNLSPQPLAWQLTGFWMMGVGGGGWGIEEKSLGKNGRVFWVLAGNPEIVYQKAEWGWQSSRRCPSSRQQSRAQPVAGSNRWPEVQEQEPHKSYQPSGPLQFSLGITNAQLSTGYTPVLQSRMGRWPPR